MRRQQGSYFSNRKTFEYQWRQYQLVLSEQRSVVVLYVSILGLNQDAYYNAVMYRICRKLRRIASVELQWGIQEENEQPKQAACARDFAKHIS
jgi:hypothetical protein